MKAFSEMVLRAWDLCVNRFFLIVNTLEHCFKFTDEYTAEIIIIPYIFKHVITNHAIESEKTRIQIFTLKIK